MEHTLRLDWKRPPLSANYRMHWAAEARVVRDTRAVTRLWGRSIRPAERVEVTLTWFVPDNRKRDRDNLVPTLKALCDGLVDAHVVLDDTDRYMVKNMPSIVVQRGVTPHMRFTVHVLSVPRSDARASISNATPKRKADQ